MTDRGLAPSTTYSYAVLAYGADGYQSTPTTVSIATGLPQVPLGSPLNYFGGDASRTVPVPLPPVYAVDWPTDYESRVPAGGACNVGTASGQGLGRWSGSPLTYSPSGFSGSTQCRWTVRGQPEAGPGSAVPPPDYTTRPPTNPTCRALTEGTGAVLGSWTAGSPPTWSTTTSGAAAACTWARHSTDLASVPAFAGTQEPATRPCRVGYETDGAGGGFWPASGAYQASTPSTVSGNDQALGNRLCTWLPSISSFDPTPPNPIAADRSPGFWAMIEGPATVSPNGDPFSPRCYTSSPCSTVQNLQYRPPADADRGFWYVVKMPDVALGSVDINVFDASYNPNGSTSVNAGDRNLGDTDVFSTEFRVYQQTNPYDFGLRASIGPSSGNQSEGSCHWSLGADATFQGIWKRLCTIANPTAGATYLVQVQTTGTAGNGINGYAIEAVAAGGATAQPALYAYANMGMQNNNTGSPPPPATFYLAEVGPQYAGGTLVLDLWDPGDASGDASLFPKMPSPTVPRPSDDVPAASCSYTSSPAPNAVQTTSPGGGTGQTYATAQPSDYPTRCGIKSTIGGARQFNGTWVSVRIAIPSDYTCTEGVNPETTPGSCWWGIEYNVSASVNDVTTWRVRVESG